MSARLYPGWGSGKGVFEGTYKAYAFSRIGRDDLEAGDKLILPSDAFREVTRLKLPFPLTLQVHNDKAMVSSASGGTVTHAGIPSRTGKVVPGPPDQYAGVYEFSAPDGTMYVPSWMLANLKVRDGGSVRVVTVRDAPRGTFVRFRPHSEAFVELAASIGPRDLLEMALRNYSVLSTGERILIEVMETKYFLDVVEVKPGTRISLLGDLDLEVEFAPVALAAKDAPEAKVSTASAPAKAASSTAAAATGRPASAARTTTTGAGAAAGPAKAGATATAQASSPKTASASRTGGKPAAAAAAVSPRAPGASSAGVQGKSSPPKGPAPAAAVSRPPTTGPAAIPAPPPTAGVLIRGTSFPGMEEIVMGRGGVASSNRSDYLPGPAGLVPSPRSIDEPRKGEDDEQSKAAAYRAQIAAATAARVQAMKQQQASPPRTGLRSGAGASAPPSPLQATVQEGWMSAAAAQRKAAVAAKEAAMHATRAAGGSPPRKPGAREVERKLDDHIESKLDAPIARTVLPVSDSKLDDGALHFIGAGSEQRQLAEYRADGETTLCSKCGHRVPSANFPLHALRCRQTQDYHKVRQASVVRKLAPQLHHFWFYFHLQTSCPACHVELLQKDMATHLHCPDCMAVVALPAGMTVAPETSPLAVVMQLHAPVCPERRVTCECGGVFKQADVATHKETDCPAATKACTYCNVAFKRGALVAHEMRCGARTTECEVCGKLVVRAQMATHLASACPGPAAPADARVNESKLSDDFDDAAAVDASARAILSAMERDGFVSTPAEDAGTTTRSKRTAAAAPVVAHAAAATATLAAAAGLPGARSTAPRTSSAKVPVTESSATARPSVSTTTASRATPTTSGAPVAAARAIRSTRSEVFPCPHCHKRCSDYEALQMHVFTECAASPDAPAAAPTSATTPRTSARGPVRASAAIAPVPASAPTRAGSSQTLAAAATSTISRPAVRGTSASRTPAPNAATAAGTAGSSAVRGSAAPRFR